MPRPPDRRRGPGGSTTTHQGPSVEIRHDTDSQSLRHGAVNVVDMAAWRERRDLAALSAALDHLDSRGCCACWVMPRPHPSWEPRPDPFVPVTGERPAIQALLWEGGA